MQAALLAAAGATGPAAVIEGRFGLLAAHGADAASAGAITGGLGERWEAAAMSIKPFPACHFAHASTWAAGELVDEQRLAPDDIAEIVVRIPPAGEQMVIDPIAAKRRPLTPYDAKFSLPFTVAHRIVHGGLGLDAFSPAAIADPAVLALAGRVSAEPLRAADGEVSRFGGGARVRTAAGVELDRLLPHAPGSPGNPLDDAAVEGKFRASVRLALDEPRTDALARALRGIAGLATLEPVMAPLREARAA